MSEMEGESTAIIPALIEKATSSTSQEVDPRLLKSIKSAARSSAAETAAASSSIMTHLRRPHSQVRLLSLLIADELFVRSKLFRSLLVPDLDLFLTLTVGFRRNLPLPPPSSVASALRAKSIEILEKWTAEFGVHYRQLRLGFDYLKNTLRLQFPDRQQQQLRRRERELISQQILMGKFDDLRTNYSSIRSEIQSTIDEINQCLEIIDVRDDGDVGIDGGEEEEEEFVSMELREIRLRSLKEGERVRENSENRPVFDAIRELYKLLVSRHLVSVQDWISVLVRVDVNDDNKFRDVALKEFIDVRNLIRSVKKKCDELGCVLDEKPVSRAEEEEEEDLWEEGKIEAYSVENANKEKGKGKNVDAGSCFTSKNNSKSHSSSTSLRSKLIAEAPVVDWSLSLDDWGSNRDALANQRGIGTR